MSLRNDSTNSFPFTMATGRGVLGFYGYFMLPTDDLAAVSGGVSKHMVRRVQLMQLAPGLVLLLMIDAFCVVVCVCSL